MGNISLSLKNKFESQGLSVLGAASLDCRNDFDRFSQWISEKKHAGLSFLEENGHFRRDPSLLLPGAKAALIVGLPYRQEDHWPMSDSEKSRVAQYARFKDYHSLLRKVCQTTLKEVLAEGFVDSEWRVCVDSAPLLERALAAKTGEGFIGKNTCFIHPQKGSFLLLAEILTTHEMEVEEASKTTETNGCDTCTLCQVSCPTDALSKDYEIDSRKCLSYWTIENRGTIPEEFWPWLSKYYFGCDICQVVCPYNEAADNQLPEWVGTRKFPDLFQVATMDQEKYEAFFGGTPMTRAKRSGLMRNALIALTVTGHQRLEEAMGIVEKESEPMLSATLDQVRKWRSFGQQNPKTE
jgi:epoxyqueuosine reductase